MNTLQFAALLRKLAVTAEYAGDKPGAAQLQKMAGLFDTEPERNLSKTLIRGLRSSPANRDSLMNTPRALQHLRHFRDNSQEMARKNELESLDAALEALSEGGKEAKAPASSAPKVVQSHLAEEYLSKLEEAGDDRERGEEILADLRSNKALDVAQLNWLVQQYAGASSTFSSRPLAIKRIGERLLTIVRRGEKAREIKRLTDRD